MEARAFNRSTVLPPRGSGSLAELSGSSCLEMGGMNLRSCCEHFTALRLMEVLASHLQGKSLEPKDKDPLTVE